ncbi:MAG: CvpA family protein [bacterium]|nr:CvpA family protein [bacterium]
MFTIDALLLILLGGFVLYGFWFGLIHTLGGLVGVVIASIFAGRLSEPFAVWIQPIVGGNPALVRLIVFVLAFIIITRLVGFIFWLLERAFKIISIIPFLKTINRLLGACLGFLEGVFLLGAILFVMAELPLAKTWHEPVRKSEVARYLVRTYSIMAPLLPASLRDFDPGTFFKKTQP